MQRLSQLLDPLLCEQGFISSLDISGWNCQVQSPAPALWAGQSNPPLSASVPHVFLQAPPDHGCITTNLPEGSVIRPRLMQLMVRDKMKAMVTRGTGWDPSPKQGMFGWAPVRSYTCWLRMPREKHFTPQWVLHYRLNMGGQKEEDPLHSTPPSRRQLWPQTVAVVSFVMPGRAHGVTLLGLIPFFWDKRWRHNGTALPERDSWQCGSSCKAHLRVSCSASHGLPTVRSKAERSPEYHLWQQI